MRVIVLLWAAVMAAACTKKNPEACCVDAADCADVGLPEGSGCDDGLTCRENRCVELACSSSAQCDPLAPYCGDGTCQQTCVADTDCPGFQQTSEERFCEMGSCVACRGNTDCGDATAPICDGGSCRRCDTHAECPSGVCTDDGSCAAEPDIAYAAPLGSPGSGCTRNDPCTIARALELALGREYVLLASGSYVQSGALTVDGRKHIIGDGSPRPTITRNSAGSIFTLAFGADATFDNVEITAASTGTNLPGYGIECPPNFNATVRVVRSAITNNASDGIRAQGCTVEVRKTVFDRNHNGINVTDAKVTVEQSVLTRHTRTGLTLDGGLFTITNNYVYRNVIGADLFPNGVGTVVEFNTIVDNSSIGVQCQVINNQGTPLPMTKNLIARNTTNLNAFEDCDFAGSMIIGNDISALKFKSPNATPYDYHLTAGSMAIDQISSATQTSDFDGEPRPSGAGFDFGADELH